MKNVEGWNQVDFGSLLALIRNGYAGKQVGRVTSFPVSRIETISDGFVDLVKVGFVDSIPASYLLKDGDILLSNINSLKHIGKAARVKPGTFLFHGMNLLVFRAVDDVDAQFLFYKLTNAKPWFEKMAAQAINQASINQTTIKELLLDIPTSKPEQTKIAEIISTVDRAIEQTKALIAKQQRIKTGLMQDLLTRGIDEHGNLRSEQTHPFKDSPLGRIPVGWEVAPLSTRISLQGGYAFRSRDYTDDGIQVIRIGNLFQNQLSLDRDPVFLDKKFKRNFKNFVLKRGDIIMSMTGTMGKRDYGFAVQIDTDGEFLLNQRVCRFLPSPNITKAFLLTLLHSEGYLSKLYDSAGGTKQANLNSSNILDIFVQLPPLKEQELTAYRIDSINGKISADRCSLYKLHSLKTALMQDLLTGKKRVVALLKKEASML